MTPPQLGKIDHVAIAVEAMAEAAALFCDALGARFLRGGDNDTTKLRLVHLQFPGLKLELMQPLANDTPLRAFLDKRGPGFHHLTFVCPDLNDAVTYLADQALPLVGADFGSPAWREVFLSPQATFGALVQFAETTLDWNVPAADITLAQVLAGQVVWRDFVACLR